MVDCAFHIVCSVRILRAHGIRVVEFWWCGRQAVADGKCHITVFSEGLCLIADAFSDSTKPTTAVNYDHGRSRSGEGRVSGHVHLEIEAINVAIRDVRDIIDIVTSTPNKGWRRRCDQDEYCEWTPMSHEAFFYIN